MSTLQGRRFAWAATIGGSRAAVLNRVAFSAGTAARLSIGFFTWLAAARLYPASQVGMAASAISALLLCVEVGVLGVDAALIATFPQHRGRPTILLNTAITVASICAVSCGLGFLILSGAGFRALHFLTATPGNGAIFLALVILQTGWWLMDQAAVALQLSSHVPIRAAVAGATTLSLVIILGAVGFNDAGAILLAWCVAALAACVIGVVQISRSTGGYRFRPLLAAPLWRELVRVGLPNFAVTAADIAPALILPIVASQQLSSRYAAYWYTVWMMAFAAYSIPWSFGLHLFAELSAAPAELVRRSRETLRSGVLIAAAAALLLIIVGPTVLKILGHSYAQHGGGPLRLAALAAIPMVVVKTYLYTCRAIRRLREGTIVAASAGIAAVALATAAAPHYGLSGIAGSWLAVQSVAAIWAGFRLRSLTAYVVQDGTSASADRTPPPGAEPTPPSGAELTSPYGGALTPRPAMELAGVGVTTPSPPPQAVEFIAPAPPPPPLSKPRWRGPDPRALRDLAPALIPLAIGGGWAISITQLRLQNMTDLGLISALPAATLLMLALLTGSFAYTLLRRPVQPVVALVHVLVLIIALYGITEFVEAEPRFSSAYRHVGIIDYLLVHGSIKANIDAYFDWPGFFALGALVTKLAGWHSAVAFAAWGPLLFNLLYLPPLLAIFRWASDDPRVRWLGLWVFFICNWVGQDYISPQGIAFFLWLCMLALLLRWFTPSPRLIAPVTGSWRAVRARFGRRAMRARPSDPPSRALLPTIGVLLVILLLYGATVVGHQLTPVPAILSVIGLVLFAGLRTRGLPVLMIAGLAVWIAFLTTTYLSGHISQVTGGLGGLGSTVGAGVGSRLSGSVQHALIAKLRVVISLGIWLLAAIGAVRRLRNGRLDNAIMVAGAAPFLLPALQPYGGEIFLRVFLFALPATAFFIATAAFPAPDRGRGRFTGVVLVVLGCLLLLGFQYTRYGNERMDNFTRSDVAAVSELYHLAPSGSNLMAANDNLPWRGQSYAAYQYLQVNQLDNWLGGHPSPPVLLAQIRRKLGRQGGYVIFTRSTEVSAELFDGLPGVLPRLAALVRQSSGVTEPYHDGQAMIFHFAGSA